MAFVSGLLNGSGVRASTSARVCSPVRSAQVARRVSVLRMADDGYELSDGKFFDSNPVVIFLALAGWIIPSSVPANIPLTGGKGLTPAFLASIQDNLARYPQGPAAADPFWTLCFMFHLGMFATLIFGTIGYNLTKSE
mmetsp:Transcript_17239/g.37485  ORF Transcript_17239/g.37485 Transcript_17239/m.37485 type:complete len:138 (-) Transcript_17239:147-560(-)|eukprot:CAMPEP_0185851088 /NCGR_PEP_ID=MMETSP1354-20130828/5616_1 /TAXON_ID=708628 /ORGANISM="Erythrolobus madagascarensis, Strain CCMP3276" /LENGTH=137 /DNA_ID=CAMNT_0028551893 /DNA_START=80 /DNA_END=493 /DNA_ORIENTATION=+